MSLVTVAQAVLRVLDCGEYTAPSGRVVSIAEAQAHAVARTRLFRPDQAQQLLESQPEREGTAPAVLRVTDERTQDAARRLVEQEGLRDPVLLNFASARRPGGGFLTGARAQEEDLARCCGLFRCLEPVREYYEINRNNPSALYTDHLIYSPQIPWFCSGKLDYLEQPFRASVITSPAPNAGEYLRQDPAGHPALADTLRRRAGHILAVAEAMGHRVLLLGAWGCGVFRNDPAQVAQIFRDHLLSPRFLGAFERVEFAVYDRTEGQVNLGAFRRILG